MARPPRDNTVLLHCKIQPWLQVFQTFKSLRAQVIVLSTLSIIIAHHNWFVSTISLMQRFICHDMLSFSRLHVSVCGYYTDYTNSECRVRSSQSWEDALSLRASSEWDPRVQQLWPFKVWNLTFKFFPQSQRFISKAGCEQFCIFSWKCCKLLQILLFWCYCESKWSEMWWACVKQEWWL